MTAKSFTKKPVTIEAMHLTIESMAEVKEWCGATYYSRPPLREVTGLIIFTLEGNMIAELGDWIIKGIKGEFYPCKPDIFEATYASDKGVELQHMQSREPGIKAWALVSDVEEGTIVQVFGIPCVGEDGTKHIVYCNRKGDLFLDCSDGEHTLDGQIDGNHYIGIRLAE